VSVLEEVLSIFDENHQKIGEQSRAVIHTKGLWHETFHCWIVQIKKEVPYLYFQQRSKVKKDFPNLFDITAAGHILAHETVIDGLREVEEELGLILRMDELQSIGIIEDTILHGEFMDNEFAHIFMYNSVNEKLAFHLQEEEVSGIFCSPLSEVIQLFEMKVESISLQCVTSNEDVAEKIVTLNDFVPHGKEYMNEVLYNIQHHLRTL
jgi:isopentenyldiphosphate isomerase